MDISIKGPAVDVPGVVAPVGTDGLAVVVADVGAPVVVVSSQILNFRGEFPAGLTLMMSVGPSLLMGTSPSTGYTESITCYVDTQEALVKGSDINDIHTHPMTISFAYF